MINIKAPIIPFEEMGGIKLYSTIDELKPILSDKITKKIQINEEWIRYDKLQEEQRQQVDMILYYSANISRSYWHKEEFFKILTLKEPESARNALAERVKMRSIAVYYRLKNVLMPYVTGTPLFSIHFPPL